MRILTTGFPLAVVGQVLPPAEFSYRISVPLCGEFFPVACHIGMMVMWLAVPKVGAGFNGNGKVRTNTGR
jgi:hypothetical protein